MPEDRKTKPELTEEEYKFYFKCFRNGMTTEQLKIKLDQSSDFLSRDIRTINKARRAYKAFMDVIREEDTWLSDPVITKQRERPFSELYEILNSMMMEYGTSVSAITRLPIRGNERKQLSSMPHCDGEYYKYIISDETLLTYQELVEMVEDKYGFLEECNLSLQYRCLLQHLYGEYPDMMENTQDWVSNHSYEFLDRICMLIQRRTFLGTCSVCNKWVIPGSI